MCQACSIGWTPAASGVWRNCTPQCSPKSVRAARDMPHHWPQTKASLYRRCAVVSLHINVCCFSKLSMCTASIQEASVLWRPGAATRAQANHGCNKDNHAIYMFHLPFTLPGCNLSAALSDHADFTCSVLFVPARPWNAWRPSWMSSTEQRQKEVWTTSLCKLWLENQG